ncbi:uncharacterized protein TNIN_345451 [Trichonephila inaurata madagascariensis]|uniref:Uncharacterized protein n=1 Tax=Trichonephila inaurata madagascariensis TaxID=2747483 RepID=A0A8X6IR91_9ARAC|nr:uncharacterized protein TNIN_345451 [Trichonephila inaurata madagascariensis]
MEDDDKLTALSSAGEEEAGSKSPAVTTAQPSPSVPAPTSSGPLHPPIYDYERVRHVPGMAKKKGHTAPVGRDPPRSSSSAKETS